MNSDDEYDSGMHSAWRKIAQSNARKASSSWMRPPAGCFCGSSDGTMMPCQRLGLMTRTPYERRVGCHLASREKCRRSRLRSKSLLARRQQRQRCAVKFASTMCSSRTLQSRPLAVDTASATSAGQDTLALQCREGQARLSLSAALSPIVEMCWGLR